MNAKKQRLAELMAKIPDDVPENFDIDHYLSEDEQQEATGLFIALYPAAMKFAFQNALEEIAVDRDISVAELKAELRAKQQPERKN